MSRHTTLRLGGAPSAFLEAETLDAVAACVRRLDEAGLPVLVLGGGSNLVLADEGVDFHVVAVSAAGIDLSPEIDADDGAGPVPPGRTVVRAEAGAVWDEFVRATVAAGLGGLECLSGIPGSVGATPVQNVGAYGVEVAQVLRRVRVLDRETGADEWLLPAELGLEYRTSKLKGSDRGVVLAVEFLLHSDGLSEPIAYRELAARLEVSQGERVAAAAAREVVLGLRAGKGMVLDPADHDTWSAGSFFTNPVVTEDEIDTVRAKVAARIGKDVAESMPAFPAPGGVKLSAGWLIERAGFGKGFPGSGAPVRLSTKHTLALTNRGSARTSDLAALAREVRSGVEAAFGVRLHPEPVWVGCSIDG
ncbi:UDP-N-acetylmuramate dehydrogenase [Dietzia sp.]|uniref:UDP-N-acetylmuramate dehydrogenase n=1 Tax=Dietzia sp. TaxID=1871616 RepID=UPI002FDB210A